MLLRASAFLLFLLSVLIVTVPPDPALAQNPMLNALQPDLEKAAGDGATVIVIAPPAKDQGEDGETLSAKEAWQQNILAARAEAKRLLPRLGELPGAIDKLLRSQGEPGQLGWLFWSVGIAIGGILIGLGCTWLVRRKTVKYLDMVRVANPVTRADKFPFLLVRSLLQLLNTLVIFVVAALVAVILDYGHDPSRDTIFFIIFAYALNYFLRWVVYDNFAGAFDTEYRILYGQDEDARLSFRNWSIADAIIIIVFVASFWLYELGLPRDAMAQAIIVGIVLVIGAFVGILLVERQRLNKVAWGAETPAGRPLMRRVIARAWPVVLIPYLLAGGIASIYRVLLDLPSVAGIILAPMIIFTTSLVAYTCIVSMLDIWFDRRHRRAMAEYEELLEREAAARAAEAAALDQRANADEEADFIPTEEASSDRPRPPQPSFFKPVAERAAALTITVVSILFLGDVWGVDFSDDGVPLTRAVDILVVLFIGYLAYIGVAGWIDAVIAAEEPDSEEGDSESMGEIGGAGASRLATLLPIFRNFLLITIVVTTGMIMLSGLGVDITPLFAGAGVVGLAIGFGAQTLIRDIFSGAFFLMDDAFRRGEYIDIGSAKGTVEKISIRSMQLRHHNGPLNTVPFGEIKQLTNYSRDWVIMKLSLRLTYDTDGNKVRKMIKKLGQELLSHPEIGHLFLNPLKSQGVLAMEDSAMIMRIKFMTKPGDQFLVRRYVLDAIRKLFAANNIRFANREVTVRLADDDRLPEGTEQKALAAAAAGAALEAPADTVPGSQNKDM